MKTLRFSRSITWTVVTQGRVNGTAGEGPPKFSVGPAEAEGGECAHRSLCPPANAPVGCQSGNFLWRGNEPRVDCVREERAACVLPFASISVWAIQGLGLADLGQPRGGTVRQQSRGEGRQDSPQPTHRSPLGCRAGGPPPPAPGTAFDGGTCASAGAASAARWLLGRPLPPPRQAASSNPHPGTSEGRQRWGKMVCG